MSEFLGGIITSMLWTGYRSLPGFAQFLIAAVVILGAFFVGLLYWQMNTCYESENVRKPRQNSRWRRPEV